MRCHLLPALALTLAIPVIAAAQEPADGKATFEATCVACHTLEPPVKLAPPMMMIARHYRQRFTTDSAGIAALTAWVLAPDSSRSALPAHAIARFGLMPKPAVDSIQARAVARHVWELGGTAATGMGMGARTASAS